VRAALARAAVHAAGPNVKLQIYRARRTAGVLQRQVGHLARRDEARAGQLHAAPGAAGAWCAVSISDAAGVARRGLRRRHVRPHELPAPDRSASTPRRRGPYETGDLPELYFSITTDQQSAGNLVEWRRDDDERADDRRRRHVPRVTWTPRQPDDPASVWVPTIGAAMTFKLKVRAVRRPTSQEVYALTLPALLPDAASTRAHRVQARAPHGHRGALELSTAGTGGPWTAVPTATSSRSRSCLSPRLTMTPSADQRRAPRVRARRRVPEPRRSLGRESTVEHMSQEVAVPFLRRASARAASRSCARGAATTTIPGASSPSSGPDTQLEADIYLGSGTRQVTRADWFHLARASREQPAPYGDHRVFSLLSLTKTLKRKIPARIESISACTPCRRRSQRRARRSFACLAEPPGASPDGQRVRREGLLHPRPEERRRRRLDRHRRGRSAGNTNVDKLDFTGSTSCRPPWRGATRSRCTRAPSSSPRSRGSIRTSPTSGGTCSRCTSGDPVRSDRPRRRRHDWPRRAPASRHRSRARRRHDAGEALVSRKLTDARTATS
jgi:hypothetical protein